MRVYVEPPDVQSRSIGRIANELKQYVPAGVECVSRIEDADLVVLHIIGRHGQNVEKARACLDRGQRYVVNQYCLRSTQKPSTDDWRWLWDHAALVWSYYNLNGCIREDRGAGILPNFYHSPLGADASVFRPDTQTTNRYVIGTTGFGWLTESIREAGHATQSVGKQMFHLGPELNRGRHITCAVGMSDAELARWYSQCQYVSGLRRVEGFELPCAEGILCGARPIMFDRYHYRQWFEEFGVFVPETTRGEVIDHLVEIFTQPAVPISDDERQLAIERFNWQTIVSEYWRRCL